MECGRQHRSRSVTELQYGVRDVVTTLGSEMQTPGRVVFFEVTQRCNLIRRETVLEGAGVISQPPVASERLGEVPEQDTCRLQAACSLMLGRRRCELGLSASYTRGSVCFDSVAGWQDCQARRRGLSPASPDRPSRHPTPAIISTPRLLARSHVRLALRFALNSASLILFVPLVLPKSRRIGLGIRHLSSLSAFVNG